MKKLNILCLILIVFSFSACDKDDDECCKVPAGPQGQTGAPGADGNANVHFKIDTILTSDWNSNPLYFIISSSLTDSFITQSIVDSGVVMVYIKSGGWWVALPYSSGLVEWRFQYTLNTVMIIATVSAGPGPAIPATPMIVKIVTLASSERRANPNVNWNNYEEVKAKFNLQE